jgi:hypothetical protein
MNHLLNYIRKPVERQDAGRYLLLTLLSFAASVTLTRLFLYLTGYPQIGSGTLHIAHLLWGGLLLFIAALLPLIFANRWVYTMGALLAGAGVGLFIDEVGKFITRTNDYFYPPAAPIIYTFFLLTVLIYLEVRRPDAFDARAELYHVFESLQEVLDHDLDPQERAELNARLHRISDQADHPDLARLANELIHFLESDAVHLVPHMPGFWERWQRWAQSFEARWVTRSRLKAVLVGGLGALGLVALVFLAQLLLAVRSPERMERMVADLIATGLVTSSSALSWFSAHVALEGAVGLLLLAAAGLLAAGQDRLGVRLGYFGLLLSLTAVNLLVFYFDQFSTIAPAMIQFGLLLGMLRYRRLYLVENQGRIGSGRM